MNPESIVGFIALQLGISEAAFRLLIGVFSGYPLAFIYRKHIYNKNQEIQCLYFAISGFLIGFWNFGFEIFHCLLSIVFSYFIILLFKASIISVTIIFISTFSYLLVGYYFTSTDSYDITWTMPYCILVLRLIGVAFDAYDGSRPKEQLSSTKFALKQPPTLLQMLGHSFFPSAFLVGPQFTMTRFLDFVNGKFNSKDSNGHELPPDSMSASLKKLSQGLFYLATYQALSFLVSDDLLLSDDFAQTCIFKKLLLMEGACIMFGLSYNDEEDGKTKWDGVANIKLSVFENSTEFNHYIQSFNVNTNDWVARHIYKRLKFLGNKYYSQAGVLLFLAVWHGIHSGYYVTFLHEFIVIFVERDVQSFVKSNEKVSAFFSNPTVSAIVHVLLRLYTFIFMGWSVIPFVFLQYPRYMKVYANCSYSGFIVHYLWPILYGPLLRMVFKRTRTNQ
ncbi:hypothetical protein GWI33_003227 [Rhynchophorus ferrugineus]|uniref:Lysophospholipid acyltransferase 5 n=1 Tax=Rhynchophorus ferrugineus TaxID=354439 RepID=A0A834IN64_RHYFE|nr:hypothetical protein GWI33_003227 [Rhynchophorus ferrugineus]